MILKRKQPYILISYKFLLPYYTNSTVICKQFKIIFFVYCILNQLFVRSVCT